MRTIAKPILFIAMAALLPLAALGQETAPDAAVLVPQTEPEAQPEPTQSEPRQAEPRQAEAAQPYGPRPAAEVALDSLMFNHRPVVIFADSPEDPEFQRQIELITRNLAAMELRDVVIITDTDPAARSEWRLKLRPRGFSLVLMDKDLRPVIRKPIPWDIREITAAIDKFPLRRQEMLERSPAGR